MTITNPRATTNYAVNTKLGTARRGLTDAVFFNSIELTDVQLATFPNSNPYGMAVVQDGSFKGTAYPVKKVSNATSRVHFIASSGYQDSMSQIIRKPSLFRKGEILIKLDPTEIYVGAEELVFDTDHFRKKASASEFVCGVLDEIDNVYAPTGEKWGWIRINLI